MGKRAMLGSGDGGVDGEDDVEHMNCQKNGQCDVLFIL